MVVAAAAAPREDVFLLHRAASGRDEVGVEWRAAAGRAAPSRCGDGGVWGLWGAAGGAQRVFGGQKGGVRGLRGAGLPSEPRRVSIVACGGEGPHRALGISGG